jgi:orotidine-5'-phosphate decarboxylase
MDFFKKLNQISRINKSMVCIGLDPDKGLMPTNMDIFEFNRSIIDATSDLVCSYKVNFAFYEAINEGGFDILKRTIKYIPDDIPVIGDAKRGDIGNTARAYARSIFQNLGCDATTVSPYLGLDSIEPFIGYKDKGVFIICRTSNSGAKDFQSLICKSAEDGFQTLFEIVAKKASLWNTYGNIGLVVGATYPDELKRIRLNHPHIPLLIPGIGAQGGDLTLAVRYGIDANGDNMIISSSRQILYASRENDFAQAARQATILLRDEINSCLT